ncbi:MAG: excisionase family DNA-binding protein [Rhodomicrobium sp.]
MPIRTEPTLPSAEEAILARAASRALEEHRDDPSLRLLVDKGTALELPQSATDLLLEILKLMAAGNAVSLIPVEAEVTTQQAADLLNVSRPYLVGLIDNGTLPARMVGNQRRLPLADVLTYKADTKAKRRAALAELSALDQELGLR